ncbi:MAG TPA: mannitol-1-phosphate 5-dehydrogenase, partial [bacterium]|nr:mannitol-1-phosphate 5-dehydrogenase [bacterium]
AGHKKNYKYIWEVVKDKKIENLVRNAYLEIKSAIHRNYGIEDEEIEAYYRDLLERFSNKALGDTIIRVAREPIRKLGPEERIIG